MSQTRLAVPKRRPILKLIPFQRNSFADSILTEAVLIEIKRQSSNGCLLCSLDELQDDE
jgi:hypothetical protein